MSREGKLAIGVLLLVITAVIGIFGPDAPNASIRPFIPVAVTVVGVPAFLLLLFGILPPRGKRATMVFVPSHLFIGLGATAAGALTLFLFYQVLHVMPQFILIAAMLAVPGGLLFAATCWSEATPEQVAARGSRSENQS